MGIVFFGGVVVNNFDMVSANSCGSGGFSSAQMGITTNSINEGLTNTSNIKTAEQQEYDNHPLSSPSAMLKNGIFIWCDADGIWTVFFRNGKKQNLSATISSEEEISLISSSETIQVSSVSPNTEFKFEMTSDNDKGVIQFASNSEAISLNAAVNDNIESQNVYIGKLLSNPDSLPVTLHTRISSPGAIGSLSKQQGVTSQQSKGSGSGN